MEGKDASTESTWHLTPITTQDSENFSQGFPGKNSPYTTGQVSKCLFIIIIGIHPIDGWFAFIVIVNWLILSTGNNNWTGTWMHCHRYCDWQYFGLRCGMPSKKVAAALQLSSCQSSSQWSLCSTSGNADGFALRDPRQLVLWTDYMWSMGQLRCFKLYSEHPQFVHDICRQVIFVSSSIILNL